MCRRIAGPSLFFFTSMRRQRWVNQHQPVPGIVVAVGREQQHLSLLVTAVAHQEDFVISGLRRQVAGSRGASEAGEAVPAVAIRGRCGEAMPAIAAAAGQVTSGSSSARKKVYLSAGQQQVDRSG